MHNTWIQYNKPFDSNFDKAHHCFTSDEVSFKAEGSIENSEYASPINYYQEYRKVETESLFGNSSYEFRGNMFDSSSRF